ncbi:hypothetical protein [Saccharothrix sp. S26]|uniref:hypothetical protein n=1 Tax=Saccharothrix sp. S26 TaxID=2907215 RepID=UPI001F2A2AAE|nr:hypothetical protein [Saccharothrix sp. S26]
MVRAWWSAPSLHPPTVLAVTGARLAAVSVYESRVDAIVGHPGFTTKPTPVFAIPGMPMAYFLVKPPCSITVDRDEVRVLAEGTTLPLPPATIGNTAALWLVSPEEAGNTMLLGDEFEALLGAVERVGA